MSRELSIVRNSFNSLSELENRREISKRNLSQVRSKINELKNKVLNREISYGDYEREINTLHGSRTLSEWHDFYEEYLRKYDLIEEERRKEFRKRKIRKVFLTFFALLFGAALIFAAFNFAPKLVGYVVLPESVENVTRQAYVESVNLIFTKSGAYEWIPLNKGRLDSIAFYGSYSGLSHFKIYLDDILIVDSKKLEAKTETKKSESKGAPITGFAIGIPEGESSEESGAESGIGIPEVPSENQTSLISPNQTSLTSPPSNSEGEAPATPAGNQAENRTANESKANEENDLPRQEPSPERKIELRLIESCTDNCELTQLNLNFNKTSYKIRVEFESEGSEDIINNLSNSNLKIDEIFYIVSGEVMEVPGRAEEEGAEANLTRNLTAPPGRLLGIEASYANYTVDSPTNTSYGVTTIQFNVSSNASIGSCYFFLSSEIGNNNTDVYLGYTENLQLSYHFNNDTGENETYFKDFSSKSNNASSRNSNATHSIAGRVRGGLLSPSNAGAGNPVYVNTTNALNVSNTSGFTVSFWLKVLNSSNGGAMPTQAVIGTDYWNPANSNSGLLLKTQDIDEATYNLIYQLGGPTGPSETYSSAPLNVSQWHHVVLKYFNTSIGNSSLYVDGLNVYNNSQAAANVSLKNNLIMMSGDAASTNSLNGTIDELAIWNASLSDVQIKEIYESQKGKLMTNFNTSRSNYTNSTMSQRAHNAWFLCNDTLNNYNYQIPRVLFSTAVSAPNVSINLPPANWQAYNDSFLHFNVTTDISSTAQYSVDGGVTNITMISNGGKDFDMFYIDEISNNKTWVNTTGLVALYHLNNDSAYGENDTRVVDFSGMGNNGTASGGVVLNTTGKIRGAGTFDGVNDQISIADNETLKPTSFTLSTWITWGGKNDVGIAGKWSGGAGYFLWIDSNVIKIPISGAPYLSSGYTPSTTEWTHVVGTFNGSNVSIYINGVIKGSQADTLTHTNAVFEIGRYQGGADKSFNGSIDEVAVWNRSLSAGEIASLYNSQRNNYLSDNNYTLSVYANSTSNVMNRTTNRTFIIDTLISAINFTGQTPSNNTVQVANTFLVNVTSSDANNHSVILDFNDTLILWMRFDNASDVSDYSSSSSIVYRNGTSFSNYKVRGGARDFNGTNDNLKIENFGQLNDIGNMSLGNFLSSYAVGFWIKGTTPTKNMTIIEKFNDSAVSSGFYPFSFKAYAGINFTNFSVSGGAANKSLNSTNVFDNNWHYIAGIIDMQAGGTAMQLYVDGALVSSTTADMAATQNEYDVFIGSNARLNQSFNGTLDEITIYHRALKDFEVNASYNAKTYPYFRNFSGVPNSIYYYEAYSIDSAGNINQTETRQITVDSTAPIINVNRPLNQTYTVTSIPFNFTTNEDALCSWSTDAGLSNNSMGSSYGTHFIGNSSDGNEIGTQKSWINTTGLAGLWHFNNDSAFGENDTRFYDFSGNQNNGTCSGTTCPTFNTSGKIKGARTFDGVDDNITILDSVDPAAYSVSMWVRPISTSQSAIFLRTDGRPINAWSHELDIRDSGGAKFYHYTWDGGAKTVTGTTTISANTWYHVVITAENNGAGRLYVNGVEEGTNTSIGTLWPDGDRYLVGADSGNVGGWFSGSLDEVAIWNRSLSATEILDLYNNQSGTYLGDGGYNVKAYCQDTGGSKGTNSTIWFSIDTNQPPAVTINNPLNITYNVSSIIFNVTTDESSTCRFSFDAGVNNYSMQKNGNTDFNYTNSSVTDGGYTTNFYCNDTAGAMNNTRNVTFFVDAGIPNVSFVSPTSINGSYLSANAFYINLSTSDSPSSGEHSAFVDINNNLSLWLRFNNETGENATFIRDWARGRNNATAYNGSQLNLTGKYGKGWGFDGVNDIIFIPYNESLKPGYYYENYTVSLWFKPNGSMATAYILAYGANFQMYQSSNSLSVNWAGDEFVLANNISIGPWQHYAVVMKSGSITIYRNGNKSTSGTSYRNVTQDNNLTIGSLGGIAGIQGVNGTIDEVLVFKRALNETEIGALYNANINKLSWNVTGASEGNYSLAGYAQDLAGNLNQTQHRLVVLDTTAPVVTINLPQNQSYSSSSVNFNFTTNENSTCLTSLNGGVTNYSMQKNGQTDFNYTNSSISEGGYNVYAYCNDTAGNAKLNTTIWFGINNGAPLITIISPLNQTYNQSAMHFNVSTNEYVSYCNYTFNGGVNNFTMTANSSKTGFNYTYNGLADGDFTAKYLCVDLASNINDTMNVTFHKDAAVPLVTIQSPLNQSYSTSVIEFNVSLNEEGSVCWFSVDDWTTNYTQTKNSTGRGFNYTYEGISDGDYVARYFCNDTVGNSNMTSRVNFNVDSIPNANVTSCGTLNQANTEYRLMNNVSSAGTCFTIAANNITLDGRGYTIKHGTQNNGDAIRNFQGYQNITVKNIILNHSNAVRNGSALELRNNNISANFSGIYFINNTIYLSGTGYSTDGLRMIPSATGEEYIINSLIENNTFIRISGDTAHMEIVTSKNVVIRNNNFTKGYNVSVFVSGNHINFTNNIISNGSVQLYASNSHFTYNRISSEFLAVDSLLSSNGVNNTYSHNIFNATNTNVISIESRNENSTISNNTLYSSPKFKQFVIIDDIFYNFTYFIDQNISNYSFGYINKTISVEQTRFGKINFILGVNGTGNNLSAEIQILNNTALINSTINPGLNRSANITFYHMSGFGLQNPKILRRGAAGGDAVECQTSGYCYNFTPLTDDTVVFNVSGAGLYNITEGNVAPNVTNISYISDVSITEGGQKNVEFYAIVNDKNGYGDISTVKANFTNGTTVRKNDTCKALNSIGTITRNYSCTVDIWYFDTGSTWNITVYATDAGGLVGQNTTMNFTLGQTGAFVIQPSSFTFNSINPGDTNKTPTNNPLTLNNTGNKPIASGDVRVNATNLAGESNSNYALYAGNFTAGINTGGSPPVECGGTGSTWLSRSVFAGITGAVMPTGNLSAGGGAGQENLYVCLTRAGNEISQQAYSTANQGAWTISIFAVLLTIARRRKLKEDRLVKALVLLYEELRDNYSKETAELVERTLVQIRARTRISKSQVYELVSPRDRIKIPVTIFTKELGGLEAIVKYLKENIGMSYSEIGRMLKRDERTIWNSYAKASDKKKEAFIIDKVGVRVPLKIFESEKMTALESLINYLNVQGFGYSEISRLINRDPRNVRAIGVNAEKKILIR